MTALAVRVVAEPELCELVRRSGCGDQVAFAEFYAVSSGYVAALLRTCQPDDLVTSSVVDTYLALWDGAVRFDPHQVDLWAWVASHTYRVVRAAGGPGRGTSTTHGNSHD